MFSRLHGQCSIQAVYGQMRSAFSMLGPVYEVGHFVKAD